MQCREVRDLLDSFVGQELLVETNHELMRHLEACSECRAELEGRKRLRSALQRAFNRAESLQARADFAAEMVTRARTVGPRRAKRPALWTWGALAASLVLISGAAWMVFRNNASPLERDAVGDHRNCAVQFHLAERPISLAEAAVRYDPAFATLEDTPPTDVSTAAGPARVVDRHACVFNGTRFGHVVLTFEGEPVSVLVAAASGGNRPVTTPGGAGLSWLPDADGLRVASFRTTGHVVFVVSALQERQFRAVAQALADPVTRRLAVLFALPFFAME
jgi:putative zinc finger protein